MGTLGQFFWLDMAFRVWHGFLGRVEILSLTFAFIGNLIKRICLLATGSFRLAIFLLPPSGCVYLGMFQGPRGSFQLLLILLSLICLGALFFFVSEPFLLFFFFNKLVDSGFL